MSLDVDRGLFAEPEAKPGEHRWSLTPPLRTDPPTPCQECGRELEAYAGLSIHGLSAGYLYRHADDFSYWCAPAPRIARPYDGWVASDRVRTALERSWRDDGERDA